jgi:hypothetical protein
MATDDKEREPQEEKPHEDKPYEGTTGTSDPPTPPGGPPNP